MTGREFTAVGAMQGMNNTPEQQRRATATVIRYAFRKAQDAEGILLARELIDELGLNGRRMATSRHRKVNGKKKAKT